MGAAKREIFLESAGRSDVSRPAGSRLQQRRWSLTIAALAAAFAIAGIGYGGAVASAFHTWTHSEAHQFALLVLPISLYLIWQRRFQVAQHTPAPVFWPLLAAVPLGLLWLASNAVHVALGTQIAVLGLFQVLLLSLLGWRVYKALLFPFLFLWLLVPFGDSLVPYLMRLTTHLTAGGLTLAGLDVTTDGNIVISQAGRVGIVEDCSALDFVIGNLVISLVFANLVFTKNSKRIAYVLAAIPVAILANNVRTTSVILITYWSGGAWDLLSSHRLYGWGVFLVFVAVQMALGARFSDPKPRAPEAAASALDDSPGSGARTYAVLLTAIALIAMPPLYATSLKTDTIHPSASLCAPEWLSPRKIDKDDWHPVFVGAQAELHSRQAVDGRNVDFYVAYYWHQEPGAELVGWPNAVFDGKAWHFMEQKPVVARIDGRATEVLETRLRGPERGRRLTWHWYWVDGRIAASPAVAKLLQAKARLLGSDQRAAAVVLSTTEGTDPKEARRAMQALLARGPFVTPMLDGARSGDERRGSAYPRC